MTTPNYTSRQAQAARNLIKYTYTAPLSGASSLTTDRNEKFQHQPSHPLTRSWTRSGLSVLTCQIPLQCLYCNKVHLPSKRSPRELNLKASRTKGCWASNRCIHFEELSEFYSTLPHGLRWHSLKQCLNKPSSLVSACTAKNSNLLAHNLGFI